MKNLEIGISETEKDLLLFQQMNIPIWQCQLVP